MKKALQQYPFFLLLLPLFFVFHGYVENYFFIRFADCWILIAIYATAALILYAIGRLLLKDRTRAAIMATFILAFYLFFGVFHDFFQAKGIFLHRYIVLLPAFIVLTVALFLYLKKRSSFPRFTLFLNTLLILYLIVDGCTLAGKTAFRRTPAGYGLSSLSAGLSACDSCAKPDIYFILFDCYSGNKALNDVFHYDNSAFEEFLQQEGFQVQKNSRSNYSFTPFSMASILNLSYLDNLPASHIIELDDYANVLAAIRNNRVVNFLLSEGYSISNYSPFDLPGHPALWDRPFMPASTRLITDRTLLNHFINDIGPWMEENIKTSSFLSGDRISPYDEITKKFISLTKEESTRKSNRPRFIYTHLFLPHPPFIYDSLMHRRTNHDIITHWNEESPDYYLQYLPYTNSCARDLLSAIRKNSGGKAVIIFMSDHGFRPVNDHLPHIFNNQNAIYFPDKDYHLLYDSISAVNQFRVVFNKLFRQELPILKDSPVILTEKNP